MHLKRIEIAGFKSFAERTRLELGPGVTAVVGPNGSGKSNIADAIRWALGEQSARELRGSRMEDVIWSGSLRRKPVSLAEVSLTLDNSDGYLPIDFTEVTVARRVDRSGTSDYSINRAPCRLKDVIDLIAGSGMACEAYSFIGQGRIDEILSHKPEDRRLVLEEAAGISRYKHRKAEALRLLEHARARAARLEDVAAEIARRLPPLQEEAERAARHEELSARLGEVEASLMAMELRGMRARLEDCAARNRGLAEEVRALEEAAGRHQSARDGCREQLEELERELDAAGQAVLAAAQAEERAAAAVQRRQDRLLAIEGQRQRVAAELSDLERRLAAWKDADATDAVSLAALREEVAACREAVAGLEAALAEHEARRAALAGEARRCRDELWRAVEEVARSRNQVAAALREEEVRERERSRLEEEERALAADAARLAEALGRLAGEAQDLSARLDAARREREGLAGERAVLLKAAEEAERRLAAAEERVRLARARLDLIREMENAYEGYAQGPRTVLRGRDRGHPAFRGVMGVVAGLVRVPEGLERAIDVALGPAVQHIVVAREEDAQRAVEELKRSRGGRATFLPLDTIRPSAPGRGDHGLGSGRGALGWAADLVECEPHLRPVVAHLLGRVLVARDLAAARELARSASYRYRVVTVDGEVIHPGGAITGGEAGGGREQGLIGRANESARLAAETAAGEAEREAARAELASVREKLGLVTAAWQGAAEAEQRLRQELERAQRDKAASEREGEALQRRLSSLRGRLAELERQSRTAVEERERLEAAVARAAEREAGLREALAAAERQVAGVEAEREALRVRLVQERVRLAALEQDERSRRQREEEQRARRRELEGDLAGRREALARLEQEEAALAAELAAARAELERARAERERHEAALGALQERREEILRAWKAEEEALTRARDAVRQAGERLRAGEVEEARLRMEFRALAESLEARYGLSAEAALALPAPPRPSEARALARRLRAEIEAIGPYNPRARQQYEAEEERLRAVQAQLDDLARAAEGLRVLAELIDRRMEKVFTATVRAVREEFRTVFARLFGGGEADLVLLDPGDALSSGVDIIAQPPGKRPQHLSLLSGGERALTAIALVFALLRVRPVPFCVMDEIDAALDDANVERFAAFLREMAWGGAPDEEAGGTGGVPGAGRGMQFLIITHQKGTMEAADRLFGVTMEDDGISRLVSVRLGAPRAEALAVAGGAA